MISIALKIGAIFGTSLIGGTITFYLAGGIPGLARDVGIQGAWGLTVFMQLFNALLTLPGFFEILLLGRKFEQFSPNMFSVILCTAIVSSSINLGD